MKTKRKVIENGKTRLNLRIPAELDKWTKRYAFEKNTTVTQLIVEHFTELRRRYESERVEQI